jgi:hypothetical protein
MATFIEVLHYLSPGKSFYSLGETYEDIVWEEGSPRFTKEEFLETFEVVDQVKNEKNQARVSAITKLQSLGLTEDEAKAIAGVQD